MERNILVFWCHAESTNSREITATISFHQGIDLSELQMAMVHSVDALCNHPTSAVVCSAK